MGFVHTTLSLNQRVLDDARKGMDFFQNWVKMSMLSNNVKVEVTILILSSIVVKTKVIYPQAQHG